MAVGAPEAAPSRVLLFTTAPHFAQETCGTRRVPPILYASHVVANVLCNISNDLAQMSDRLQTTPVWTSPSQVPHYFPAVKSAFSQALIRWQTIPPN